MSSAPLLEPQGRMSGCGRTNLGVWPFLTTQGCVLSRKRSLQWSGLRPTGLCRRPVLWGPKPDGGWRAGGTRPPGGPQWPWRFLRLPLPLEGNPCSQMLMACAPGLCSRPPFHRCHMGLPGVLEGEFEGKAHGARVSSVCRDSKDMALGVRRPSGLPGHVSPGLSGTGGWMLANPPDSANPRFLPTGGTGCDPLFQIPKG